MWRISMTKKNYGLIFVSNLFLQIFGLFAFFYYICVYNSINLKKWIIIY